MKVKDFIQKKEKRELLKQALEVEEVKEKKQTELKEQK